MADGEMVYKTTYVKVGKGVGGVATILFRFVGDELQWVWSTPGASNWSNYIVYTRTRN